MIGLSKLLIHDSEISSSDSQWYKNTAGKIDQCGENEFSMLLIDNILPDPILGIMIVLKNLKWNISNWSWWFFKLLFLVWVIYFLFMIE